MAHGRLFTMMFAGRRPRYKDATGVIEPFTTQVHIFAVRKDQRSRIGRRVRRGLRTCPKMFSLNASRPLQPEHALFTILREP